MYRSSPLRSISIGQQTRALREKKGNTYGRLVHDGASRQASGRKKKKKKKKNNNNNHSDNDNEYNYDNDYHYNCNHNDSREYAFGLAALGGASKCGIQVAHWFLQPLHLLRHLQVKQKAAET